MHAQVHLRNIKFYSKDFRYALWSFKKKGIEVAFDESYILGLKRVTTNAGQHNSWVHRFCDID
jgi:hypothetical protein